MVLKVKENLRNYFGLQDTKDTGQINATCDSEWGLLAINDFIRTIYKT